MLSFKNFNIADWFSFYRILAFPFLLIILVYSSRDFFSVMLLISYSTDAIDGQLARKFKIMSARGSQLDSLGDQLTFIAGIAGLVYYESSFIKEYLFFIILGFVPYLLQMIIAYIKYKRTTAFHTYLAKISAIMQSIFILHSLFYIPNEVLFYFMIILGLLETIEEITLIFLYKEWVSDIKGVFWALKDPGRKK